VGQENIRPKSIAREMFESFRSFSDYIRDYELQRAEGVLLRHLNSVYKVLGQTVPDAAKNDAVREMELYLGTMIRQIDSSLLDEWEKMRNPSYQRADTKEVRPPGAEEAAADVTRDTKAFTAAIRTRVFMFLRGLVNRDFEGALAVLAQGWPAPPVAQASKPAVSPTSQSAVPVTADASGVPAPAGLETRDTAGLEACATSWTAERLQQALDAYHAEHEYICLDPNARNIRHTYVLPAEDKRTWRVQQMLVDPQEHNDWVADFEVDLARSREAAEPVLRLVKLGSLT
jgi:hypothetical protein